MPMHDWTRQDSEAFHDFRRLWIAELVRYLNGGMLPSPIQAYPEDGALGVRHEQGQRDLARVEIVSPEVKSDAAALDAFVRHVHQQLAQRIHLLILDPFPPGPHDPNGVHGLIWKTLHPDPFYLLAVRPLVFVSYECDVGTRARVQTISAVDPLPNMLLFVSPGACFELPLEATYQAAFEDVKFSQRT